VETAEREERRDAMATLAMAPTRLLFDAWQGFASGRPWHWLRRPETGLVMVRGRIGGGGAPFNLGEVPVTRCAVAMDSGETGFAWVIGRDGDKARLAALFDALWQRSEDRQAVEDRVLGPARNAREEADARARSEAAATRVEFFTLVRGDDEGAP
jgi:alpha-D-ribose 1-methylphosphonate 5-triphosphate synthase subunit PhnG